MVANKTTIRVLGESHHSLTGGKMNKQEQIKLIKEQIRYLNATIVEMAARKHKLEESLNKLLDEETKARNEALIKHQRGNKNK